MAAVRKGKAQRQVAAEYGVHVRTVQYWLKRADGKRLDRVDWQTRPPIPRRTTRTDKATEDLVLEIRHHLRFESALGEYGADEIHAEMVRRGIEGVPCVRTIGRILRRRGALDRGRRVRRVAPARGWYLPDLAAKASELDSFDVVQGLVIRGGFDVQVLNVVSLHGHLVGSWPMAAVTAKSCVTAMIDHWREWGLPQYTQFDNDTRFQGAHHHKDSVSRVMRLCLSVGVVPVFAPPREHGFQAAVESYNGRWQTTVWHRFNHADLDQLQERSNQYVDAHRAKTREVREKAPKRRSFPVDWQLDLQAKPRGQIIYLRRTDGRGTVFMLGRRLRVDPMWRHRLVRCEVDLARDRIAFISLRRSAPDQQDKLNEIEYHLPERPFTE